MIVINELTPSDPKRIAELQEPGPTGPIVMVNLLKFREKAEYADGRETELSGREAYRIYAKAVVNLVEKHGGKGLFFGDVTFLQIGQVEELWDEVALAQYPNRAAMRAMATSAGFREIAVHREAGLAGQLNIETTHATGFGLPGAPE
jgi:uncharacterized protein (DUF1330 family)